MRDYYEHTDISDGATYTFKPVYNAYLIVEKADRNGKHIYKKNIKIKDSDDYIYSIKKTQINAIGGADGLYKFLVDTFNENFAVCLAENVLRACDNIKETKIA